MPTVASALRYAWRKVMGIGCAACGSNNDAAACRACLASSDASGQFIALIAADPALRQVLRVGRYFRGPDSSPLAVALLRFKYHGDRAAGHALRRLFQRAAAGLPARYDVVVPVPLHRRRLRERRYNQAAWLARGAARGLGVPLEWRVLVRVKDTAPQAASQAAARRALKGAFEAQTARVTGLSVLLVDDVYTTGTTAADAARTLLRAGAAGVDLAVLLLAGDVNKTG